MKLEVILERYPYRFVQFGKLKTGYQILEYRSSMNGLEDTMTCLLDSQAQSLTSRHEYTKWLDPDPRAAYLEIQTHTSYTS